MINRVVIVGRITKDPELRFVSTDIPMVRFSVACNRNFTNKDGEREVDFINCIVWRKQAENLTKYIAKGALLGIEGSIRTSSYSTEEGVKKYVTEVLCDTIKFLETKKEFTDNQPENTSFPPTESPAPTTNKLFSDFTNFNNDNDDNDDGPF